MSGREAGNGKPRWVTGRAGFRPRSLLAGRLLGWCGRGAVEGEQDGAEDGAVVGVELGAECGGELVFGACRVLLAPFRDGGAGPVQVCGLVLAVPHNHRVSRRAHTTLVPSPVSSTSHSPDSAVTMSRP